MKRTILSFTALALFAGLHLSCLTVEMSESQKRKECAKAYGAEKPADRVAALEVLRGCKETSTFIMLNRVATADPDPSVRAQAFSIMAEWPDPEGKLCTVLLPLFLEERHPDGKLGKARSLNKLVIKTPSIDAVVTMLTDLFYPNYTDNRDRDRFNNNNRNNNNNNNPGGTVMRGMSRAEVEKAQKRYTEVVNILNQLSGQSFRPGRKTNHEVRTWWKKNIVEFKKTDAETIKRLREEMRNAKK